MKITFKMSIYKRFRSVEIPSRQSIAQIGRGSYALSSRFDQPTYLSFRLVFGMGGDMFYNNAANANFVLNYDRMPHPLFAPKGNNNVFERDRYSAIDYLLDANEFTRAAMLENFISLWNKLQEDYQWYFQKIDGINDLLKIDPVKGMRITSDKRLAITALEGLDLRLSHLMNLYRKIAWDDTYQRWVLPDMMRYFTLNIYIAEFRTFHTPNPYNGFGFASSALNTKETPTQLKLNILDDILPVWQLTCEMCEFDIQSVEYDYLTSLGVDQAPTEAGVKFGIKVGKVYETQIYPTFQNAYLIDKYLNGLDRSKNEEIFGDEISYTEPFNSTYSESNNNSTINNNKTKLGIAQSQSFIQSDNEHISGASFNQQTNKTDIQSADNQKGVPAGRAGWLTNAKTIGLAFLENTVDQFLDKSKITPIPGLGISFTEVKAALEGKNIITALGLLRKGVNEVIQQYGQPSELLEREIYLDDAFRVYLQGVSKSEATDDLEISLIEAANIALNDDGTWGKIKDFSLATDLVGPGEINQRNVIKSSGGVLQTNIISAATSSNIEGSVIKSENSNINKKITGNLIFEGVPSSQATTNKL